ncbi:MAG: shikimate kinase, partial [Bdellovibrionales bacterium]
MKYLIIGHRGVGKSEFLKRVKKYYILKHVSCLSFDLDTEIEARTRKTISEIFRSFGEKYFREVEESILKQIFSENMNFSGPIFVAVGAGYSGSYPKDAKILWLRRPTDESGRIFLDRPRLNPEQSPYEEYFARFHEREIKFREVYHREIMIGEGWNIENDFETTLLGLTPANLKLSVTISSELIENEIRLEEFIESHLFFGVKYFELRNDLLSDSEIYQVAKMLPREKVLISFRPKTTGVGQSSSAASQELIEFSGIYDTDWALELGPSPLAHNKIISLHTRLEAGDELESIEEAAERLLSHKADHYKL